MKKHLTKKHQTFALSLVIALALVLTAPLTGIAGSTVVFGQDLQQNRVIAHAMEHKNQKLKSFKDRKSDPLKISVGEAWCAWFIEHCAYEAKLGSVISTNYPAGKAVGSLAKNIVNSKKGKITFVNKTIYNKRKGDFKSTRVKYNKAYKPRKGDIVLYSDYQISGSKRFSHVGFIYEDCDNALSGVKTIEGNTMAKDESNWERTSKVGVRSAADDTNKERRIVAYITPNYCKHSKVDPETGKCTNTKCKADYFYFDSVDTSCATDEEAGVTYHINASAEAPAKILYFPSKKANTRKTVKKTSDIVVLGTVSKGAWYKVTYTTSAGTVRYGYIKTDYVERNQIESEYDQPYIGY